ncbi:alpha/beta hydrolase [Diaphorobacter limosus]|uniref:Alpha/beta hydrolase n=1 Tax=Diaphorobacter limosus TaxID=3036128 RepID=A0ABZ0J4D9_9BURK|nr:alpha/beta hydrolase [Diaphorobacter sp. Y-1]WOO31804.1 alpha/beta hydrolase [Diaphorobacter sp. Y-1]
MQAQRLLDAGRTPAELDAALKSEPTLPHARFDTAYRSIAGSLAATIVAQQDPRYLGRSKPLALDNDDSVWNAVVCNDEALPHKDLSYWVDAGFALARQLPFVSTRNVASQPCLHWQERASYTKPALTRLKDVPLMMLQSAYDVPTPAAGAQRTFEQLPAARMVHVQDEGGHGLLFYGTDCVELNVWGHLLGQPPAARETTCAGKALPLEDGDTGAAQKAAPVSNFTDPVLAERLIRTMRRAIDGPMDAAAGANTSAW